MAPRLPPSTRRLVALRSPLHRLPASASPLLLQPLSTHPQQPPSPLPLSTLPKTTTRPLTTTIPRPWLLSALPNLNPNGNGGSPSPSKTLRARRLLPYPPDQIYTLISDIDSYRHFLPHCAHSHVTRWTKTPKIPTSSSPSSSEGGGHPSETRRGGERLPALADLTVGWGPFTQTYTSRVYCVPGQVVEAVSGGSAETSIPRETLLAVGYSEADLDLDKRVMEGGIFESLVTRWTVKPISRQRQGNDAGSMAGEGEGTEVTLSVTFRFANPALGFAVGQVADDMVDEMVEAFEGRARQLYGRR